MSEQRSSVFRPDIEGLRAIAIGLVLLYHAGLPFLPGGFIGVDVFFVISGFLITSLLVRESERTGRVSLRRFYARRAKRLLPASAVVLVVTAILTALVIPASDRRAFGIDIASAAAYVVNWRFAAQAVDYLAEGSGVSPVLHFWSLAIEEQFYLVWPLLIIVALVVARRLGWSMRRTMMVALAVVGVPSFVASVVQTAHDPATAFFFTTTRMWELAVGAAVAIAAPRLARLPQRAASATSIVGLVVIAASAMLLTADAAWPGWLAALPVVAAALVIAGGVGHPGNFAARLLGVRPMVWLGGISYSLYLWHWPVLVFAAAQFGPLTHAQALALAVASIVPAYLSMRFVENPARYSRRLARGSSLALAMGAALSLAGVAAGLAVALTAPTTSGKSSVIVIQVPEGSAGGVGAQALGTDPTKSEAGIPQDVYPTIQPAPASAPNDIPAAYDLGCQTEFESAALNPCSVGDLESDVVIAAVGDSKMLQYYGALDIVGQQLGVRFEFLTKSACPSTDAVPSYQGAPYETCVAFNKAVDERLLKDHPSGVITAGSPVSVDESSPVSSQDGFSERWSRWQEAGIPVSLVLEYPRPEDDVYKCLEQNPKTATECAYDRAAGVKRSGVKVQKAAAADVPGITTVDLSDFVCPRDKCAPVIGNVLVLRQGSHLTNTYALTLSPQLIRSLAPFVDGLSPTS